MSSSLRILGRKFNNSLAIRRSILYPISQVKSCSHTYSTTPAKAEDLPPKYTTSMAAKWKASESFTGEDKDEPWYQSHVVVWSTAIFLIYFCILREENDIDEALSRPLHETIPMAEKPYLQTTIRNLKAEGKDYSVYEKRLKDLEESSPIAAP